MTIICAVREIGGTWIAADSLVSGGYNSRVGFGNKWAEGKHVAVGVTGPYAVTRAVEHHISKFKSDADEHELWKVMRLVLKDLDYKGVDKPDSDDPPYWGFSFLFATPDRIVSFGGNGGGVSFGIGELAARGSGCSHTEGAWSATAGLGFPNDDRLLKCVEAACSWDTNCGGLPFYKFLSQTRRRR